MSTYAYDALRDPATDPRQRTNGNAPGDTALLAEVTKLRDGAKRDRKRYEPVWRLCQSFLAGRQWVGIQKRSGRVLEEPNPRRRERHTANVLTQYFEQAVGRLYSEDMMPAILFERDDFEAQKRAEQARHAHRYAWDEEVGAQDVILDLLIDLCGYGTVACQCTFDTTRGPYQGEVPVGPDGRIVWPDEQNPQHQQMMGDGPRPDVDWRALHEGRITWHPISVFHLLPPPGIYREQEFPWVIIDQAVPLDQLQAAYGDKASGLAEQDLAQVNLIGDREMTSSEDPFGGTAKLTGHALKSTIYYRPTRDHPEGREVCWSQQTILHDEEKLPYVVNGEHKAGIAFFRYHRVPRRFWGIGLVEPGIGPQRQRNRARSQHIEMKDKNLGRVYARRGSITESNTPVGKIMELIEVKQSADFPTETSGVPPGPWIADEVAMNDGDLEKVMGMRDLVNSESMKGVTAYAAFALQAQQEEQRAGPILAALRSGLVVLSKFTGEAMKIYWPPDKQIAVAGDDDSVSYFVFNASAQMPAGIYYRYSNGSPAPRNPAAEIQKIFDVYDRSVSSGRPLGVPWLMQSLEAGKCIPFPQQAVEQQKEKAQLENMLMAQGQTAQVSPLDDHQTHIPEHQLALQQSMLFQRQEVAMALQEHIAQHQQQMQAQSQLVTSVPGQQGSMGQLGAPQAQAANAGQGLAAALAALGQGGGQTVQGGQPGQMG